MSEIPPSIDLVITMLSGVGADSHVQVTRALANIVKLHQQQIAALMGNQPPPAGSPDADNRNDVPAMLAAEPCSRCGRPESPTCCAEPPRRVATPAETREQYNARTGTTRHTVPATPAVLSAEDRGHLAAIGDQIRVMLEAIGHLSGGLPELLGARLALLDRLLAEQAPAPAPAVLSAKDRRTLAILQTSSWTTKSEREALGRLLDAPGWKLSQ